jgi:ATP-dependent protease ClpP protease subunit
MNALFRSVLWLVLLTVAPAWAGPFEEGVAAYDRKEYAKALELWLPLAQRGDHTAQFNVGVLYEKGLGVERSASDAAHWYLEAAQQGDLDAQYGLALLYETGSGVAKDVDEARKWYHAILANPATDPVSTAVKQRAQARLAKLVSATEDVVAYKGGRFVIARASDGTCVVGLQGAITTDAAPRFRDVILKAAAAGCEKPWLLLESPGGLLFDALDLGLEIRRAGFRTIARSSCASACSMLFVAGSERILVGSGARIGLHQSARNRRNNRVCDPTTYSSASREMAGYLQTVIPQHADELMKIILQTPCDTIEWVSGQRALDLGIATRVEWGGVQVGPPPKKK